MKSFRKIIGAISGTAAYFLIIYLLHGMFIPEAAFFDFSSSHTYFYWAAVLLIPYFYLRYKAAIQGNDGHDRPAGNLDPEIPEEIHANVIIAAFAFYPIMFTVAYTVQHALLQSVPAFFAIELSAGIPFYLPFFICNAAITTHVLFKSMKKKALKNNSLHF